ncbi:MAG TPA: proline dehydrogenase family protein [Candidatus Sulfotelmatobacter sp.]|nr:proline dehydrogenase family protein [Candidatus Sulfotelmatobacter sp.]
MAAAASVARELPGRAMRGGLLWASRRRSLARVATATPLTRGMVWRFVAGEDLAAGLDALARLRDAGFHTTADVLGEAVSSEAMAARAADSYIRLLEGLAERGLEGNVSVKLTQLGLDHGIQGCRAQLLRVVEAAARTSAFVRIDMEDHHRTDATLALVHEMHATHPDVGAVIQAYLRRSAADVAALIASGTRVRLCKGAYQEPASVAFPHKADVDTSYERLARTLLVEGTYPALATHDERLIERLLAFIREQGIERSRFEFQMLYGIRRDLQDRLRGDGYTVRVYVPFGTEWYPYFMRRLAERPANVLFLTRSLLNEGRARR